jgi:protein-disulfide isomerase
VLLSNSVRPLTNAPADGRISTTVASQPKARRSGRSVLASALIALAAPLALMLAGTGIAGCNKGKTDKPAAASATACADYSKKLCDAAGAESPTCNSAKEMADLMPAAACAAALGDFGGTQAKLEARRKACDELVSKLCKDLGPETETCDMVKTQSKNIPPDQCSKMMSQYAELLADLKKRESRNQPLAPDKAAEIAKPGAPSFGPDDAKVTVVAFSDFQCPYCSKAATVITQLKEKYSGRVRIIFRQFPLSFHKQARLAAEAALAANAQGKFWEFHDRLFQNQSQLERPALETAAKELGLNMPAFKKALDTNAYAAAVDADMKLGEEVMVSGTPTMFVNGKRIADPTNLESLTKQIDDALAHSAG